MANDVNDNDRRVRYIATSGQTVFDIDFSMDDLSTDDVAVFVNGAEISAYTVDLDDLTVTLDSGASEDDIVVVEGAIVIDRESTFPRSGDLRSAALNEEARKTIFILQEAARNISRALILNKSESDSVSTILPLLAEGKALIWGAAGLENSTFNLSDLESVYGSVVAAQGEVEDDLATVTVYTDTVITLAEQVAAYASAVSAALDAATIGPSTPNNQIFVDGVDFTAGVSTTITVTETEIPVNIDTLTVFIDGLAYARDNFTYNSTTGVIDFGGALGGGVSKIEVQWWTSLVIGVPGDASITWTQHAGTATADRLAGWNGSGNPALISVLDEDNMSSDDEDAVPSQQSVKAYVDAVSTELEARVSVTKASDVAASSDTTYTFDYSDGAWQKVTVSSDCTFAFTFPASKVNSFILEIVNGGAHTITWPGALKWAGGAAPDLTTSGTDHLCFYTDGTTVYASVIGEDVQ